MAKRGNNKAAKQRGQEREKQRRQASADREPGPEAFGIKMPQGPHRVVPLNGLISRRLIGTS
jgi:hypothetical protein